MNIEVNTVIVSRDGAHTGRATGRTRKCCLDCPTHSNACEVVWGNANGDPLLINWVCMGTLRCFSPAGVTPPTYTIVSVQEGIDALGEHEQSQLLDAPPEVIGRFIGMMFGFPVVEAPTIPSPYFKEVVEFNNGDRGEASAFVEAWINEGIALVREDWRTK